MTRLKESTQALHDATENGEFNRQLVQGRLPLESYIESLGQLFLIHRSLERELRRHQAAMAPIGAVVRDYQFQEPYLRNDLAYFGRNPDDVGPLTATRNFIGQVQRTSARQPIALLGMHYVLEGSNNGSKFISRAVRRAYGLSELNGTHYLDPYGDRQKEYWESFKADMNQQVFSESDTAAILDAAAKTFEAVMELHLELYRLVTPDSVGS
jgi:heme oxygenase